MALEVLSESFMFIINNESYHSLRFGFALTQTSAITNGLISEYVTSKSNYDLELV
jgi:hypothetical protein